MCKIVITHGNGFLAKPIRQEKDLETVMVFLRYLVGVANCEGKDISISIEESKDPRDEDEPYEEDFISRFRYHQAS